MLSQYACDSCRTRKIRCSREQPVCTQCSADSRECFYSRQGVIRRNRKTKHSTHASVNSIRDEISNIDHGNKYRSSTDFQSQLEADIDAAQEGLKSFPTTGRRYSGNLASLSAEYTSFWQDPAFIEMAEGRKKSDRSREFFTFEDQAEEWTQMFPKVMEKGKPWFTPIPPEITRHLASSPGHVRQSAYLVIFYSIMLTMAASDPVRFGVDVIPKMQWNLWLALNDAKLLLEPSDLNIQALFLLATHVQDFHTPSLCWMLLTTACRMLQAMGVSNRSFDQKTKERRLWLFWGLNAVDMSLALIFGRPPSFHRAMREKLPVLSFHQLKGYQPHIQSNDGRTSLFGAHFMHQLYKFNGTMAEIWSCLYDSPDTHRPIEVVKESLDSWYQETSKILEATYLAEEPIHTPEEKQALEIGINFVVYQYHYHCCILLRGQSKWRQHCLQHSREALLLLDKLVSDSNEVYNGVIWALLYCPFSPFFILFGDVLSKGNAASKRQSLEAMEKLPEFMEKMAPRHPQAGKLYHISISLVKQARSILVDKLNQESANVDDGTTSRLISSSETDSNVCEAANEPMVSDTFAPETFTTYFSEPPMPIDTTDSNFWTPDSLSSENAINESMALGAGALPEGYQLSDMFMQSNFDWFAWDSNVFGFDDKYSPF